MSTVDPSAIASAWRDVQEASERARVVVRTLRPEECPAAAEVLRGIWGSGVIEAPLLVALGHAGSYVAGAFDGDVLVGVCVGFLSQPVGEALHSHVAGVSAGAEARGIGTAMKLHQRAWCLDRGLTEMTWTYDPLVARNAAFNMRRLGASLADYLVDFYGPMSDGVNAGQGSDRILVSWRLDAPLPSKVPPARAEPATEADAGSTVPEVLSVGPDDLPVISPMPARASVVMAALPPDIEDVRRRDPDTGALWRVTLRDTLVPLLDDGWRLAGVTREGRYRLEKP
ncbi:hypothetical protein [Demequina capsici]|uniref:N-acetyltransferase domain-containing protein n=1 Tax=Demequina capsici TaxID=3075620 RepID=A0AA96F3J4_9MICO|nr:hypothetical protein [Demequina sp. OYTSA14]WNM23257.1 hypothetical protein RN606_07735 [Demequina sp. OYTSA14]